MCGVAGLFDFREARLVDKNLLDQMTDRVSHRGPDARGTFIDPGLGLGHRRLSIIDISTGQQPMTSLDGQIVVSYNGEIYNFMDVRRELEGYGYRFKTHSDTEVILAAWAEWGESCVKQFRGMFAFALYDRRTQTLFLARDRLGVKPMHYAVTPQGWVVFGSELKSVIRHPDIKRHIDPQAIEDYFSFGYIADPRTIFSSVRKLPAGHTLTVRRGMDIGLPRSYWDVSFEHRHTGSEADLSHELVERVRESVKIRLMSEVPLGAFLSGGVDSSAVVAMMAELSSEPVNTCSIGFDVAGYDETEYAQKVAQLYKTKHKARTVKSDDIDLIDKLVFAYDEPFADASALPTYQVCALARESVTVALSGDGGDELFAGYRRHRLHAAEERVRSALPLGFRRSLFGMLGKTYPKLDWAPQFLRAKTTFQALGMSTGEAYTNSVSVIRHDVRLQMFTDKFRQELQGYNAAAHMRDMVERAPSEDAIGQIQYADLKIWLPGDILTKMDRASMAVSLESREPLLDHKLLEWASGLPAHMRIQGGQGKYILKKAFEPYLPHDILYRPKQGFVVPISNWFRGPLKSVIAELIETSTALDTGYFNKTFLKSAFADHCAGTAEHGRLFWSMLMFDRSLAALNSSTEKAAL
jgi:asparagine synthase (glutamine-hydrolysing)